MNDDRTEIDALRAALHDERARRLAEADAFRSLLRQALAAVADESPEVRERVRRAVIDGLGGDGA